METKQNNYLPFDLETALKHPERVVTRDGRRLTEIYHFKSIKERGDNLYYVVNGVKFNNYPSGNYYKECPSKHDLFLLPEVKECWVNVYESDLGKIYVRGASYADEYSAKSLAKLEPINYIKTIRITNEPE